MHETQIQIEYLKGLPALFSKLLVIIMRLHGIYELCDAHIEFGAQVARYSLYNLVVVYRWQITI